eukprot:2859217-Lingulodinium_polyedra.AAC.1
MWQKRRRTTYVGKDCTWILRELIWEGAQVTEKWELQQSGRPMQPTRQETQGGSSSSQEPASAAVLPAADH